MPKIPLAIIFSSLLFLLFPAELTYEWIKGQPISGVTFFISGILPVILLIGLLRVSRVGWYTLVCLIAVWGIRDVSDFYRYREGGLLPLITHLGLYLFSLAYFLQPRVRVLYFDPSLHWWREKHRYETFLSLIVKSQDEWVYPLMRNLSEGGCFLQTHETMYPETRVKLLIPFPVPLDLPLIEVEGEVRWVSAEKGGVGIQFVKLASKELKTIKQYLQKNL